MIGGARSGKGRRVSDQRAGLTPVYLATATAGDGEMTDRIRRHQERRGDIWQTVEEPLDLVSALKEAVLLSQLCWWTA